MRTYSIVAALVLIAAGIGFGIWRQSGTDAATGAMPETVDIAKGQQLYAESCAACHGANLEGQPDWRQAGPDGVLPAPPHDETGHTWHHADRMLFDYTKLGGKAALARQGMDFASGMPVFGDQLSDAEIWNIIAYIKSTWPERERAIQAERNADPG